METACFYGEFEDVELVKWMWAFVSCSFSAELLDIRYNILFFQILAVSRYVYLISNSVFRYFPHFILVLYFLIGYFPIPQINHALAQIPHPFILISNNIDQLLICSSSLLLPECAIPFAHSPPGLYTSLLPSLHILCI